mgnify:CR=1 FL=1
MIEYLDGSCHDELRTKIDGHLVSCAACRAAVMAWVAKRAVTLSAAVWRRKTGMPSSGSAWLTARPA